MRKVVTFMLMGVVSYAVHPCIAQGLRREPNEVTRPRIVLTRYHSSGDNVDICYEIRNGSSRDVWVCDDMHMTGERHYETVLHADGHTLIVCKRLDVAMETSPFVDPANLFHGRHLLTYVRLRPGEQHVESLSLSVPIQGHGLLACAQPTMDTTHVDRLLLQVGVFFGDLPADIRGMLEQADAGSVSDDYPLAFYPSGPGSREVDALTLYQLNKSNQLLDDTTCHVVIPYLLRDTLKEDVLQISVDGLWIPYEESTEVADMVLRGMPSRARGGHLSDTLAESKDR